MSLKNFLAPAAALFVLAAPGLAAADTVFGSAAQLTARDCSHISASTDCIGAAAPRVQNTFLGGVGASLNTSVTNGNGTWAVQTGANPGGLPVLKAGSWSGASSRINTNAVVFQQFTFTGTSHTLFSLEGDLTFNSSGNDGDSSIDPGNPGSTAEQAGEGGIYASMYFMDPAAFAGITGAADVMSLLSMDCTNPYMYAFTSFNTTGPLAAGAQSGSLTLNRDCSGSEIFLNTGDTAVLVMVMQTPSNRGGFMDATHTFVSKFDPTLAPETLAALTAGFIPGSPADLPEPTGPALALAALAALAAARRAKR
jgi:hypothetical protein